MQNDARLAALRAWLGETGLAVGRIEPASVDASFRRYFRVYSDDGSRIAMDAPPDKEDCGPFVRVAGYLAAIGLNSPRVEAEDIEQGFLLLTDLGDEQYLERLRAEPTRADELYEQAMTALATLQRDGAEYQHRLPPYGARLLQTEMSLFSDWLCGRHLELDWSDRDEAEWQATCDLLIESALAQPRVFVHRDYHSRNLMVTGKDNPGILDFQDAVNGPVTYDLVSLLRDCYLRWPGVDTRRRALAFHARRKDELPRGFDEDAFMRAFDLMGVQRHLKAAGIFARLNHRDGKPGFLEDVPRTLQYIVDVAARYPALKWLRRLVSDRCLPAMETGS